MVMWSGDSRSGDDDDDDDDDDTQHLLDEKHVYS